MKPVVAVAAGPSFQMKIEDVDPAIRAGLQEHVEESSWTLFPKKGKSRLFPTMVLVSIISI
eukprot:m.91626 g.91626  ORF g.91626 m.91626 type:complete len:61 (-) comp21665_c0_seq4:203-385(-)